MGSFFECRRNVALALAVLGVIAPSTARSQTAYAPPPSASRLAAVDFAAAVPVDETYRQAFTDCDRGAGQRKDHFLGVDLRLPGVPESKQYYKCSRNPSNVKALLRLADGAIYWHSKMALDVDGSWAAWNNLPGATDLKETAYKWPGSPNPSARSAQIDPDRIPYIVMPTAGLSRLSSVRSGEMGGMFKAKTGLRLGDMGVVIYKDRWTPAMIADGGPFMRLGEGSSRAFEALGESRCKKWSADGTTCVGPGSAYPYRNYGIGEDVIFIVYPGTRRADLTPRNAIATLCAFAEEKLGLTGGAMCP